MTPSSPILHAHSLSYSAPGGRVLATGLNFELKPGQILFVLGPNGSGKSTLINLILGFCKPLSGNLAVEVPRSRVSHVPQLQNMEFHIPLTLRDVLNIASGESPDAQILGWGLLEKEQLDLLWSTASGGERQKTLMTRALIGEPQLLILDEPFNHLDEVTHAQIFKVIQITCNYTQ